MRERETVRIVRGPHMAESVVCVGGLPGCGKTLFSPIVGSFARVEVMKYNYILEHLATLDVLGRLDQDVATTIIRMSTDLDLYHLAMSREVNFRLTDLSSVFKNPGAWRYIRRLFQAGDAVAYERIKRERPILHYVIHSVLPLSPSFFRALGSRLRVIEVVRHPLYMVRQWFEYIHRYGEDARDFTIWLECAGRAVPWFAYGREEQYLRANRMDQVIYGIEQLTLWGERVLQGLSDAERAQVLVVPFEGFVLHPWPYLTQMERVLGTERTRLTRRELKRQRVPRQKIADGLPLPIYKQCGGWEPPERRLSEADELSKRRKFAAERATPAAMDVLDRLSRIYEARYAPGGPGTR